MAIVGNKIGEYIHYKYENYMRYGLAYRLSTSKQFDQKTGYIKKPKSLESFINEAKYENILMAQRLKDSGMLQELQDGYNYYRELSRKKEMGLDYSSQELQEIQNAVFNSFSDLVSGLSAEDIDWESMTFTPQGKNKLINSNRINMNKLAESLADKGAKALKLRTLRAVAIGKNNKVNIADFLNRIKNIEEAIEQLDEEKTKDKLLKQLNKIKALTGQKQSGRLEINDSYLKDLKKLSKEVFKLGSISLLEGLLAEHIIGAIGTNLGTLTKKTYEKLTSEVVGSLPSNVIYDKNQFAKNINLDKIFPSGHYKKWQNGIIWEAIKESDGKIDVSLQINDAELKASIKNYDLDNLNPRIPGINFVSDTNLLYQFSTNPLFLNHYLNQSVNTAPQGVIMKANQTMKKMFLLMAMTGGGLRKQNNIITSGNQANIFIINDKSKGKATIVTMGDLYSAIIDNYKMLQNDILINLSDKQSWQNDFVSDQTVFSDIQILDSKLAYERITNVLAQVHQCKLKASISFAGMKKVLGKLDK